MEASRRAHACASTHARMHAHARTCMHARRVRVGAVPCMLPLTWPLYTGSTPRIPARVLDQRSELKRKVRHAPIFLLHPCMVLYVPLFAECCMLYLTQRAHTQNTIHTTTQHSTAQHSTAQHSTAQHSTAQHSTAHTRIRTRTRTHACTHTHTQTRTHTRAHTHTQLCSLPWSITAPTRASVNGT
jgi:hypothetical protein